MPTQEEIKKAADELPAKLKAEVAEGQAAVSKRQAEFEKKEKIFRAERIKEENVKKVAEGIIDEMPEVEVLPAITDKTTTALAAPLEVSPEVLEHCQEAIETLETLDDDIKLPILRLTADGFEMSKGAEPSLDFTGIIIHSKMSNVYYKGKYKPGEVKPPVCMSSNGKTPDAELPENAEPIHSNCKECPMNQWKSDPAGGDGKACKNTRPMFILVDNPDSDNLPVIPKVLRIPPTSLPAVKDFIMNACADFGALYSIRTKLTCYKKDEAQPYYNIKFSNLGGRFKPQEKTNVKYVRAQWMNYMTNGMFGIDVETMDVTKNEKVVSAQEATGDIEY